MSTKTKTKKPYVIIRADRAGVFAGNLASRKGSEVTLENARRIWQWSGAATLSQLAMEGTKNPSGCRFPQEVPEIVILGVIEIITCSEVAESSIKSVPIWKQ